MELRSGSPPPAASVKRSARPFITLREALIVAAILVFGQVAFGFFDEARDVLQAIYRPLIPVLVLYFAGRAFWRWWREQPPAIAGTGAKVAFLVAIAGWLDLLLARGVAHMSAENYGLIVIAPLTMMLGAIVSLAGLAAAGVGAAATVTALTRSVPRSSVVAVVGIASVVLNLAHIVILGKILMG